MACLNPSCLARGESLATEGWLVFKLGEGYDQVFEHVVSTAPETLPGVALASLDKSGKLPFPSSQHHPLLREVRKDAYEAAAPILLDAAQHLGLNLPGVAMTPDALLRRTTDTKKDPAKHWHRDSTAGSGLFFGGWVNMGKQDEYFRMVPRSHLHDGKLIDVPPKGFVRSKEVPLEYETIAIPPGSMLVFFERLHHTILSLPAQRLFVGFQLDHVGAASPYAGLMEALKNQAMMPIKSGRPLPLVAQHQFMYTKSNKAAAQKWARQNLSLDVAAAINDWVDGKQSLPCCPSLVDLGEAFRPYSAEEIAIFFLKEWTAQSAQGRKRRDRADANAAAEPDGREGKVLRV